MPHGGKIPNFGSVRIAAVLFDMIGTTVMEDGDIIVSCFGKAFHDHNIYIVPGMLTSVRGKNKKEAIEEILTHTNNDPALVQVIFDSFKANIQNNISRFSENHDLHELLRFLKSRAIKVGIGSGLSRDIFQRITEHLGWGQGLFDYEGTSTSINKGRPDPAMILDMLRTLDLNPSELLKVGDTVADIREGKNAGVPTVALLSGTASPDLLRAEQPSFIIHRLSELRDIISTE